MWPSRLAVETRLNRKGKETSVIQGRKWKKKRPIRKDPRYWLGSFFMFVV